MPTPRLFIGAMSGTSADGVDVALVRITGAGLAIRIELVRHLAEPYDAELRRRIFAIRSDGSARLDDLAQLARDITLSYARAIDKLETNLLHIEAIAAHGQTLFHKPPLTMQWFDPSLLAAETGRAVVSDFRRADCAVGGQGAPLVPFADWVMFRGAPGRVILNLGGIANVTVLSGPYDTAGWDTGPGNCISDALCRRAGIAGGVDVDGLIALRGSADEAIVARTLASEYFRRPRPKSTDGPEMIRLFDAAVGGSKLDLPDLLATAAEITARSIRDALATLPLPQADLIVAGGGVNNPAIMQRLGRTRRTDECGVPAQAREAMAFAILGAATMDGIPSNSPAATGARRPVVLGCIARVS